MKGFPTHEGTSSHRSAAKQVSIDQDYGAASKVKDSPAKQDIWIIFKNGKETQVPAGTPGATKKGSSPGKQIEKPMGGPNDHLTEVGDSPVQHKKGGKKHKHSLKNVGKRLKEIKSNIKEKVSSVITKRRLKRADKKGKTDVKLVGTNMKVHKSSSGSGVTKPSGKNEAYKSKGEIGGGQKFTRGGGDPYQYRKIKDKFQYKKVGEAGWSDVKGGNVKIQASYDKAYPSPTKHVVGRHGSKSGQHKRSDHKAINLNKKMQKRDKLKDEGATVEDSRKLRRVQNVINRKMDSKVRHKKNIFTGGKYKRVVKKK